MKSTDKKKATDTQTLAQGTPGESMPDWKIQLKQDTARLPSRAQEKALAPPAPAIMVQRSGAQQGISATHVRETAAQGIQGAGGELPHLDRIQSSFGAHDVSGVQAHVGGQAGEASRAIGARAYTTAGHVAFGSQPDLHTAAHEAAHVVQQRAGVKLEGGVGQAGDSHERHADSVADLVVQHRTAEPLLDRVSVGAPGENVQRVAREIQMENEEAAGGNVVESFLQDWSISFWELGDESYYRDALKKEDTGISYNDIVMYARGVIGPMSDQAVIGKIFEFGESWSNSFRQLVLKEFERKTQVEQLVGAARKLKEMFSAEDVSGFLATLKWLQEGPLGQELSQLLADADRLVRVMICVVFYADDAELLRQYLDGQLGRSGELQSVLAQAQLLSKRSLLSMLEAQSALADFNQCAYGAVTAIRTSVPPEIAGEPWAAQFSTYCQYLGGYWDDQFMKYYGADGRGVSLLMLMKVEDSRFLEIRSKLDSPTIDLGPSILGMTPRDGEMHYYMDQPEFTAALVGYFKDYNEALNDTIDTDFEDATSGGQLACDYAEGSPYERTRMSQHVTAKANEEKKRIKEEYGSGMGEKAAEQVSPVLAKTKEYRSKRDAAMKMKGKSFNDLKSQMLSQATSLSQSVSSDVQIWKQYLSSLEKEWLVNTITFLNSPTQKFRAIVGRIQGVDKQARTLVSTLSGASEKSDLFGIEREIRSIKSAVDSYTRDINEWSKATVSQMETYASVATLVRDLSIDVFSYCMNAIVPGSGNFTKIVLKSCAEGYTVYATGGSAGDVAKKVTETALAESIGAGIKKYFPFKADTSNPLFNLMKETMYDLTVDTVKGTTAKFTITFASGVMKDKDFSEALDAAWKESVKTVQKQFTPEAMAKRLIRTGAMQAIKIKYKADVDAAGQASNANLGAIDNAVARIKVLASS